MNKLNQYKRHYEKIEYFTNKWTLDKIQKLKLTEYVQNGNESTFCHDLEKRTEQLGRIGGRPSNKFGIWRRNKKDQFKTKDFLTDGTYGWQTKYGKSADDAFKTIKSLLIQIIKTSLNKDFKFIDGIDLDKWIKWKVAFIYSDFQLIPIYKNGMIREVAKNLRHPNFNNAHYSHLHQYIVSQKPKEQDFFEFYLQELDIVKQKSIRNYYIIGSKYEDKDGKDTVSIAPEMYSKGVIAVGYFWKTNFSNLYGKSYPEINKWIDKNLDSTQPKFTSAKRALSYFLELKEGNIVAVKSHGQYGNLTIIAYAEVISKDGLIYQHDSELGHTINVNFLETDLYRNTGLSYGQTIHHIIPNKKKGHFENIFGSYAFLETEDTEEEEQLTKSKINEKSTKDSYRSGSSGGLVSKTHDKLQIAFAKHLITNYETDFIQTEIQFIDILRESKTDVYFYEVKPLNSPHACIRAGIGQLLDYQFKYKTSKTPHLIIVGSEEAQEKDLKFIQHLKSTLAISFEYISFKIGQYDE
ncbi:MAG: hypothetical protein ACI9DK_002066 [Vicingaceae bacterium]|jgi:hypothetical protein